MAEDETDQAIRAHLDHADWEASMTDAQRAETRRRRAILGSLDDTHALNRCGL